MKEQIEELISWLTRLVFVRIGLLLTSGDERVVEILALRHQIRVLQRQVKRPRFTPTDRAVLAMLSRTFDGTVALTDRVGCSEHVLMSRQRRSESAAFAGYRFPSEVILLAVRWYLR
ncbi:MAG: hypothetical protein GY925_27385, partial [Actinomycetia bacterium]|nr:hypothetical protein [Actinomycetes bacterium]